MAGVFKIEPLMLPTFCTRVPPCGRLCLCTGSSFEAAQVCIGVKPIMIDLQREGV